MMEVEKAPSAAAFPTSIGFLEQEQCSVLATKRNVRIEHPTKRRT